MIVKVEFYYELKKADGETFPDQPSLLLDEYFRRNPPKERIILKSEFLGLDEKLVAVYLTRERALELLLQKKKEK